MNGGGRTTYKWSFYNGPAHKRKPLLHTVERHARDDVSHFDLWFVRLNDAGLKHRYSLWVVPTHLIGIPVVHKVAWHWAKQLREYLTVYSGGRAHQVPKTVG